MDAGIPLEISNSTIAFNQSGAGSAGTCGGLCLVDDYGSAQLESALIADNTSPDLGGGTVSGANNLIEISAIAVPPDTLADDPILLPLAGNGGATKTHALASGSPAIDAGNDTAGLVTDQRSGHYARVFGVAADIGAFEVQPSNGDIVFRDGFDP